MRAKFTYPIFICMLFIVLAGCNNDDQAALDPNPTLDDSSISSMHTDTNSKKYPHTLPIKVQEAKYEYRTITGSYPSNTGKMQNQKSNVQQPTQQQQTTQNAQPAPQATPAPAKQANNKQESNDFVASVIELTNAERKKQGLPALQAYPELNNVADVKAKDMNEKGYFSHTSPTYGSPFDMMRDFGITYKSAGENIAQGQQTPEEVVNAWMNSEGHRANILNNEYTHIGVGFEQPGFEWVQMFVKK